MTAPNGHANGLALDNSTELAAPTAVPAAAVSPSTASHFSMDHMKELVARSVNEAVAPRCGYQYDRYELPWGAPAGVTDIETGCTFCASHFREVIF